MARSRSLLQHSARLFDLDENQADENQAKRDDDFRPRKKNLSMAEQLNPLRWRKRRLVAIVFVATLLYFFVKNIPTDLAPAPERLRPAFRPGGGMIPQKPKPKADLPPALPPVATATSTVVDEDADLPDDPEDVPEPTGAPSRAKNNPELQELEKRFYFGPIRYFRLAESLNPLSRYSMDMSMNRNVLFAASNLKSLANLLPIACDMAVYNHNSVHFAIMSRVDLSMEDIKSINGINAGGCAGVQWHDARSDYTEWSSDLRHETAVAGGLSHIKDHMNPHAIIVDDENAEDAPFSRAIQKRAKELFLTHIEVPSGAYDNFRIISRLDHASLKSWHSPTIEIVVQAQRESVGSLVRMLRSLSASEHKGFRLPKLTINLNTNIPPALREFLAGWRWPSRYEPATKQVDAITIRHQVRAQQITTEQSALRFIESFYPANSDHHVLLLSPQVELSPQFLTYLHYTVLRYKYSAAKARGTNELLGIALNIPSFNLDGKAFAQPKGVAEDETVFLYSVPSSSAMLIFGDKWTVFHNYFEHRITATQQGVASKQAKVVPETEPAWMEYLLELVRARGWNVLYPNRSFATVHNELAQVPEEFQEKTPAPPATQPASNLKEPFLTADIRPVLKDHKELPLSDHKIPLHDMLPQDGQLDEITELPFVSHEGKRIVWNDAQYAKAEYAIDFRKTIGGCAETEATRPRILQDNKADDLFCLSTVEMLFDTTAEAAAVGA